MLRARLATAAVAIPLLLLLILYPSPWPLAILIFAVGIVGIGEYASMAFPAQRGEWALTILVGGAVLAAGVSRVPQIFAAAMAFTIAVGLVWVLLTRPDFEQGLRDLGLSLVGILYVAVLMPHFFWLHNIYSFGPRWVIFVVAIGMAGDTAVYFVGKSLGRHKLTPHISPGKTIEGAVGIVAGSLLVGVLCKLIFLPELTLTQALVLSGTMGVIGQLGDLCESMMKRAFGTKESGWIFPGHGGVLDRIDSLLFPVAFL